MMISYSGKRYILYSYIIIDGILQYSVSWALRYRRRLSILYLRLYVRTVATANRFYCYINSLKRSARTNTALATH